MEALEGFNRYRAMLKTELGIEPTAAAHRARRATSAGATPIAVTGPAVARVVAHPVATVPRMARSRAACATLAVALLGSAGWGWWSGGRGAARFDATVVHVVDGDTIVVDVGGPHGEGPDPRRRHAGDGRSPQARAVLRPRGERAHQGPARRRERASRSRPTPRSATSTAGCSRTSTSAARATTTSCSGSASRGC